MVDSLTARLPCSSEGFEAVLEETGRQAHEMQKTNGWEFGLVYLVTWDMLGGGVLTLCMP